MQRVCLSLEKQAFHVQTNSLHMRAFCALHCIENCLAMLSIKLLHSMSHKINNLSSSVHVPDSITILCATQWSNFMRQQFSRWGAPKEPRGVVTADIWELAHKWMQTLQTVRTKVREPQLFFSKWRRRCQQKGVLPGFSMSETNGVFLVYL